MVEEKKKNVYIENCSDGSTYIYYGDELGEVKEEAKLDAKAIGGSCRIFKIKGDLIIEFMTGD